MRKIVIGMAAAATLLAAWLAPEQDGGVVGPAAATTREPAATSAATPAAAPESLTEAALPQPAAVIGAELQIHPRVDEEEPDNIFAKQSWQPEAPKKIMPRPVQPAAGGAVAAAGAPPLPFRFMGRYTDEGKTAYFLQLDGRDVVARPGEKVDDNYLFDSVGAGALNFIYLPLNQKQTLAVGDTN